MHSSKGVFASFALMGERGRTEPTKQRTTQPALNFEKTFDFKVSDELIDFLSQGAMVVEVRFHSVYVK